MLLSRIAQVIDAKNLQNCSQMNDFDVNQFSTDTRNLQKNDLFIALRGPNFDGHSYLKEASKKGCAAAIVDTFDATINMPQHVVKDTRIALGLMAEAWRQQFESLKVVGITGSCGKTTVKEMLSAILSEVAPTLATHGNFNNDIGVPLSLLRLNSSHRYAVLELGANAMGEIAYSAKLIHPDVAVITNAAAVHVEGFGSVSNIAKEKGELYKALGIHGCAVVNGDDPSSQLWLSEIEETGSKRLICTESMYSESDKVEADFWLEKIHSMESGGYRYDICSPSSRISIRSELLGFHNVSNSLLAAAVAKSLDVPDDAIKAGLEKAKPAPGRLNIYTENGFDVILIDDTYNASPHSVTAAIELLSHYPTEQLLILGEMGELGDESEKYHLQIGQCAKEKGIHKILATGQYSQAVLEGFAGHGVSFEKQEALIIALPEYLKAGMTVLVKGSRSAHMEKVINAIRESAA